MGGAHLTRKGWGSGGGWRQWRGNQGAARCGEPKGGHGESKLFLVLGRFLLLFSWKVKVACELGNDDPSWTSSASFHSRVE